MLTRYKNLKPGNRIWVKGYGGKPLYKATVDHVNSIGQPYVLPDTHNGPKYLFDEDVALLSGEHVDGLDECECCECIGAQTAKGGAA